MSKRNTYVHGDCAVCTHWHACLPADEAALQAQIAATVVGRHIAPKRGFLNISGEL